MTQVAEVHGASDDLVHVAGIAGEDEFSSVRGAWVGVLSAPNGERALLFVDYRANGTWTTSLGLVEEDAELPEWSVQVVSGADFNSYTTLTLITVPDGTTIEQLSA